VKFDGEELKRVEEHFFTSQQRRDKLKFALALNAPAVKKLKAKIAADKGKKRRFTSYLAIAASLALLAGGSLYAWRIFFHQSDVDKGLLALNAAYREQRPIESRLSGLLHAPFSQTRGGPDSERIDALARDRAELILNTAANDPRNAA